MRAAIVAAILSCAAPVLAANANFGSPPSPPPVSYDVWGFRWDGHQYVKDPTRSLTTTDLKMAADYAKQITSVAGWTATTNMPPAAVVHTTFRGPAIGARPTAFPTQPTYIVWAFKQSNGKWVKDEAHSWTTTDPRQGLAYAKKVNAVAGWTTTTNIPQPVPRAHRYVDGGTAQGADVYRNCRFQICDAAYGPAYRTTSTVRTLPGLPAWMQPYVNAYFRANGANYSTSDSYDSSSSPSYDDSWAIQNMINTQDMINNQNFFNTQQMINNQMVLNNMQDMINTQNMIDTQNMVNTQNMIDTQNMINAMNNP